MSNSETSSYPGGTRMTEAHLDWAKICARAGEHEAALENLEAALAAGYTETGWWLDDPDFKELLADERFHKLVERGSVELVTA